MPTRGTVRITINGLDAFVRSPYEARMVIRDMPDRQWNPALKVWIIPTNDVDLLKMKLEADGWAVQVADDTDKAKNAPPGASAQELAALRLQLTAEQAKTRHLTDTNRRLQDENSKLRAQNMTNSFNNRFGSASPFSRRGAGSSWADDMFAAMSPTLTEKVWRALSKALHPDVGGDLELMQLVNTAHDKAKN